MKKSSRLSFLNSKSKTKTCKTRFVITALSNDFCPHCKTSFLSATTAKLEKKLEKIEIAKKKKDELINKKGGKKKTYYVAGGTCSY